MNPLVLLAALAVIVAGCKRHDATSVSDQSTVAAQQAANGPPVETSTDTVVIPASADINATLSELSQQLRSYVSSTRSRPKDFQDFVTRAHVQAPPPPTGKAYSISAGKVVLVNK